MRFQGLFTIAAAGSIAAAPAVAAGHAEGTVPVVVEMFVSQACSACPPAAAYVDELCPRENAVTLSWHIDYWNLLANPKHGRWRDPFSQKAFSDRQRAYNKKIRRRATVFTPQAIINGSDSLIGSKREKIEEAIAQYADAVPPTEISVTRKPGGALTVEVSGGLDQRYETFLVSFQENGARDITGGDNAGVRFIDAHVVTGIEKLGDVAGKAESYDALAPAQGLNCAVLIQAPDQGRIIAARYCPTPLR